MSKMTIMMGLPASGKSTAAKELLADGNTIRINKDLLRTMLHFDKFTGKNEDKTQRAAKVLAEHFLQNGTNVIIDDTNLNPGTLQSWKDLANTNNAKIEYYKLLDVPVKECIARDAEREKKVGRHVIEKMAMQYLDYFKGDKAIICDLDGTLCDCDHRRHYVRGEKKDWRGFFSEMSSDTLRKDVYDDVILMASDPKVTNQPVRLIYVSARPEDYRAQTEAWLNVHTHFPYSLIMRNGGDGRPDVEVKGDIYDKYLKGLDIMAVFDDRPSVIRMWQSKGLEVVDCGNGEEF